jgi:hypothetical protein
VTPLTALKVQLLREHFERHGLSFSDALTLCRDRIDPSPGTVGMMPLLGDVVDRLYSDVENGETYFNRARRAAEETENGGSGA